MFYLFVLVACAGVFFCVFCAFVVFVVVVVLSVCCRFVAFSSGVCVFRVCVLVVLFFRV